MGSSRRQRRTRGRLRWAPPASLPSVTAVLLYTAGPAAGTEAGTGGGAPAQRREEGGEGGRGRREERE